MAIPPSKHRKRKQVLAATVAVREDKLYEQEIRPTEAGRRSSELRERACRLQAQGDVRGAHDSFAEAAAYVVLIVIMGGRLPEP